MGLALVELLGSLGVPAEAVILAHLDRNPDVGEHAETAAAGAWLQLDGPGRTKYWPDSTILALIEGLATRGHGDRLLLGGDTGRRSMMRSYGGGPGLDYVFRRFKPRLERELGQELSERIFVDEPGPRLLLRATGLSLTGRPAPGGHPRPWTRAWLALPSERSATDRSPARPRASPPGRARGTHGCAPRRPRASRDTCSSRR